MNYILRTRGWKNLFFVLQKPIINIDIEFLALILGFLQMFHKRMPPEAVDLVSRLLQYSPNLRFTAVSQNLNADINIYFCINIHKIFIFSCIHILSAYICIHLTYCAYKYLVSYMYRNPCLWIPTYICKESLHFLTYYCA